MKVASIVEGHGERETVPLLVRRIAERLVPGTWPDLVRPMRLPRNKIVKPGELERAVEFLARKISAQDAILVVLDADDDCPAELGRSLLARATAARPDRSTAVILPNRELEAWFLAALRSVSQRYRLVADALPPAPESIRSPKDWLNRNLENGYQAAVDQVRLAAVMDLDEARTSRSFEKFMRDVGRLLRAGG